MVVELMERDVRSYLHTDGRKASLEARVSIGLGALSGILYLHSQVRHPKAPRKHTAILCGSESTRLLCAIATPALLCFFCPCPRAGDT